MEREVGGEREMRREREGEEKKKKRERNVEEGGERDK